MLRHTVRQGESIISLSKQYGVPVAKIWDHPDNRTLRERGRTQSILYPGDTVTIPDHETKEVSAATHRRHRFSCRGRTTWLRLRFLDKARPRNGEPYELHLGALKFTGNLDGEGKLEVRVPADTEEGILLLGSPPRQETIRIRVGHLDPLDENDGVRKRLQNLGLLARGGDDPSGERLRSALRRFQKMQGLAVTGSLDDATRNKLIEVHGS